MDTNVSGSQIGPPWTPALLLVKEKGRPGSLLQENACQLPCFIKQFFNKVGEDSLQMITDAVHAV